MNCKSKIIILLVLIIILVIGNNYYSENFGADPSCMNLSAPDNMTTCGNYKVKGGICAPNPEDCFIDPNTKERRCWCSVKECKGDCNSNTLPENKLNFV